MGRRAGAAAQHEGFERIEIGRDRIDFALQPRDLRGVDAERLAFVPGTVARRRDVGAQIEHVVLDAGEDRIRLAVAGVQPREPDRRIGLVDVADGGGARAVLADPGAVGERCLTAVAAAGIDSVELDHCASPEKPGPRASPLRRSRRCTGR